MFVCACIGALAGIMGVMHIAQMHAVHPNRPVADELIVIAGAVIGGTKAAGRQGKVASVVRAILLMQVLFRAFTILPYVKKLFWGTIRILVMNLNALLLVCA